MVALLHAGVETIPTLLPHVYTVVYTRPHATTDVACMQTVLACSENVAASL